MRDATGISRVLLIGILVVLVVIAGGAFIFLSRGPPELTTTTTPTTETTEKTTTKTTPTSAETTTETTAATPTTTAKTTSSVTSPTATETSAPTTETSETTVATTETSETTSVVTLPEIEYVPPSDVTDLLKAAESMTYEWTSAEERARYSYEIIGEESIEGVATWKVKIQFSNNETQEFTVWISQVDGAVKQVEMDGSIMTGEMAKSFEGMVALLMVPFTAVGGYEWAWQEYWTLPSDVGVVTYEGSQTQTFGPTTLTVHKFRFDPNPLYEPAKDLEYVEWGFGKLDSVGVATHFKAQLKTGEVFTFDLVSVTLPHAVFSRWISPIDPQLDAPVS